jgi:tetratricopeptide (TPR) repeat protein
MGLFWNRSKPEPPPAPTVGDIRCGFCCKARVEVRKLIEGGPDGRRVYICDECIGLSNEIIDEEDAREPVEAAHFAVVHVLERLPRNTPFAAIRRLADAALALASDAASCRRLAHCVWSAGDPETAAAVLCRIPESEREADDLLRIALHRDAIGDSEGAVPALRAYAARASGAESEIVPLYEALVRLGAGETERDVARELERHVERVVVRLPELGLEPGDVSAIERDARYVRALAARAAGELTRAEMILREHVLSNAADADAWALLHAIHRQRGEREHAAQAHEKALEHAHPDGPLARRLREPPAGPFR